MLKLIAEREHYLLVSKGKHFPWLKDVLASTTASNGAGEGSK
jgi:hypothetical protein